MTGRWSDGEQERYGCSILRELLGMDDKKKYFEQIYNSYHDKIYNFIYFKIYNAQISEDLTSDVFLAAYKNLNRYDSDKSFITTWLYAIACNRLKNYYKSSSRKQEYSIENWTEKWEDTDMANDNMLERQEWRILLLEVLLQLPERNRKIVLMKYYDNMTSKEIGRKLDLSSGNVRIILKRSLELMKKKLKVIDDGGTRNGRTV